MRAGRAFTLLELIVVLAVISVLATLAVPAYRRVGQAGRATACLLNLRQLGAILNLYLGEHNMVMPSLQAGRTAKTEDIPVIDNTLDAYAKDPRIFACPGDTHGLANATGTSYYWNSALNGQSVLRLKFLTIESQGQIPVLVDKEGFHLYQANKANLLYADGRATRDLSFITSP